MRILDRFAAGLCLAVALGSFTVPTRAHDMAGMVMPSDTPPPAGTLPGGPFHLTDQDGRPRSDRDFAGRYRLIYFGFTNCPDECPLDLKKMMTAWQALPRAQAARVAPIFITVDPARDTPAALKSYVSLFPPGLTALTGSPRDIATVEQGYKVYAAKTKPVSATEYGMAHSSYLYLMGPDGAFIDILDPHDKLAALTDQLAAKIR